jgi:hypothetical protein
MSSESTYYPTDNTNKKVLAVGGTFDDNGGSMSGYYAKFISSFHDYCDHHITSFNGGTFEKLNQIFNYQGNYDYIIWMANVPNDKPKLVSAIKQKWPKAILVISKANFDDKYTLMDLVYRALNAKANLIVEFKGENKYVTANIYDPLGNIFCYREMLFEHKRRVISDLEKDLSIVSPRGLANLLFARMKQLSEMTRQESVQDGPELEVPDKKEFFELVRFYAEVYHNLIHGANTSRMLGNVSFRCEKGFPSFRHNEVVYISKRNMDKRMIGKDGFVAVDLDSTDKIVYCGDDKPSVDAPIQVSLYRKYPWVNYMLHSHVYIDGAPFTDKMVPCGAMQEIDEIVNVIERGAKTVISTVGKSPVEHKELMINLKGHGSLVLADSEVAMRNIPYVARVFPEAIVV